MSHCSGNEFCTLGLRKGVVGNWGLGLLDPGAGKGGSPDSWVLEVSHPYPGWRGSLWATRAQDLFLSG